MAVRNRVDRMVHHAQQSAPNRADKFSPQKSVMQQQHTHTQKNNSVFSFSKFSVQKKKRQQEKEKRKKEKDKADCHIAEDTKRYTYTDATDPEREDETENKKTKNLKVTPFCNTQVFVFFCFLLLFLLVKLFYSATIHGSFSSTCTHI